MGSRIAAPAVTELGARLMAVLSLAWRNLTGERRRWLVSTLAIAVAVGLMLFSQGVVRWVDRSATAYLDHLQTGWWSRRPASRTSCSRSRPFGPFVRQGPGPRAV